LVFPEILFMGKFLEKGKLTLSGGIVYEGDFADNKRTGKGKMTYPNGKVEEGNWKDGKFL